MGIFIAFEVATSYTIYDHGLGASAKENVIFFRGGGYTFYKHAIKRSCFTQIFLFSLNALWIMLTDKHMDKMVFVKGNLFRATGTTSKHITCERKSLKTTRKRSLSRYSSTRFFLAGEAIDVENSDIKRITYSFKAAGACGLIGMCLFMVNSIFYDDGSAEGDIVLYLMIVPTMFGLGAIALTLYNNISWTIFRRTMRQINVIIMIIYALSNFAVDAIMPENAWSVVLGAIYIALLFLAFLIDALICLPSRHVTIGLFIAFQVATLYTIYDHTLGPSAKAQVILYQGGGYTFYKHNVKRFCFLQIFLFSLNALWTMCTDKKMEKMLFVKGHVFRATGTTSKNVVDERHSLKIMRERESSLKSMESIEMI